jgi:hypothetical protein
MFLISLCAIVFASSAFRNLPNAREKRLPLTIDFAPSSGWNVLFTPLSTYIASLLSNKIRPRPMSGTLGA